MKKIYYFFIVLLVAMVFGVGGYIIGSKTNAKNTNDIERDYKEAYLKGWAYWFSRYGMNGEGTQYVNLYSYGRKYNSVFENEHDAFVAGYKDGFYYVNHRETNANEAEKGYNEYYLNDSNNVNKIKVSSTILVSSTAEATSISKSDIFNSDLSNTFLRIVKSNSFRNDF